MKKLSIVLLSLLFFVFVIGCFFMGEDKNKSLGLQNVDYLRLHIRANSNSSVDQNIKYEIKTQVLDYITKDVANIKTKAELAEYFINNKTSLENYINSYLSSKNFNYNANITVQNEYFPTRSYNGVTLSSGYYDAILIKLGKAEGNNWWCVAYPPLCFMYESSNYGNITYKSKLLEIINNFFKE